jgi:peptidyl-prolyl cis-trans isomerase C
VLVSAGCLAACRSPAPEPGILAEFEGGSVTVDELERALLSLPPGARTVTPETRDERYRSLLEQLAMRELLIAEARSLDLLATPEVAEQWEETRKQIVVAAFLRSQIEVVQPTPAQVREFFETHRQEFDRPERREVYHLFLRPKEGESAAALKARLELLRDQALAGAPFPILAREHSESQLRSADGSLGWVTPGQLAPKLNDIVFGLEEGVPSDVLMTASGAHLFYAARIVAAEAATFDEARPIARRQLQQRLQGEAVNAYLETQEAGAEDFVPDDGELRALMAGGDPNAIVLKIGDFILTAGDFLQRLEEAGGPAQGNEVERAPRVLQSIAQRERLWTLAQSSGPAGEPATLEALTTAETNLLFTAMQRRALFDAIDSQPDALAAFFERERARFAGPLRFNFERLVVPLAADSGRVMSELERSRGRLEAGELSLAELADHVGGTVEGPTWKTLESLLAEAGRTRRELTALQAGDYSAASSNGREVELFHLLERSAPRLPELEEVRDEVREAYLQAHGEKLYEALVDESLAAVGFEIHEENLEQYLQQAAGVDPAPEEG